jgi:hypothetical protein
MRKCWLLGALSALCISAAAQAADRMVICEEFTATWCGPCIQTGLAMSAILDDPAYDNKFTLLQIHITDIYQIPWGNTRRYFYNITAIPTTEMDGVIRRVGSGDKFIYMPQIDSRLAVPTDVVVKVTPQGISGPTYRVLVDVSVEQGGVGKDMRVHAAQVLDYYPAGDHHRHCLMWAQTLGDVNVQPGQSTQLSAELTLDAQSYDNQDRVRFIAFVQQPTDSYPAEVYNAAEAVLKGGIDGDLNGDGCVDLTDLAILLGDWDCTGGDCAGDADGDGDTDIADLALLLGNYNQGC